MYVPQRPSLLPGDPSDFLISITKLRAHAAHAAQTHDKPDVMRKKILESAIEIGEAFEVSSELWNRPWMNLSGGEGQRILIATALALDTAEVLLLDGQSKQSFSLNT